MRYTYTNDLRRHQRRARWLIVAMFAAFPVFLFGGWIGSPVVMAAAIPMMLAAPFADIITGIIEGIRDARARRERRAAERETFPPR